MSRDTIIDASKQLNRYLIESDEYQKYCLYKKELLQFPELYDTVQEFRRRNFEIQLEADSYNKEISAKLTDEYGKLLENPLVSSYLNAELSFCKLSQAVAKNICRDIELELDFL